MLALVKTQKGEGFIEVQEVPVPEPGPNEVLIEVKACGVCGTDIHVRHDEFPYWPPVIMGHEFSGQIAGVGEDVTMWQGGERVVGEPHTRACGKCYLCRSGNIQICAEKRSPGWGIDGAFTNYVVMPEHLIHRIPDTMSWEQGAMVEPTANVVADMLERARVEPEDFVVVLGPGPIGLTAAMCAKVEGAREVLITGTDADEDLRLKTAREIGVDHVVNVQRENVEEVVLDLTGSRGADLIVECSGAPAAISTIPGLVRKKGRICGIGLTGNRTVELDWDALMRKVCDIHFNMSTSYTSWDRTISIIDRKIDVEKLITHKLPITQWQEAFDAIEAQQALKVILYPV